MSEEKKETNVDETVDMVKNDEKSSWDGSEWMMDDSDSDDVIWRTWI